MSEHLSARATHCLENEGIQTKDQAREAILSGKLHPRTVKNYGWLTHIEVCEWAGLPQPKKTNHLPTMIECPHCQKKFSIQFK